MKRITALIAVVFLVMIGLVSCGKAGGPKAGTAKGDDMLKLFPEDADGVFFVDVKRAMETEFAQKTITESEDLQEFIETTNIDPREDIYFLAGAMFQKASEEGKEKGVVIVNLNYDKNQILPLIKEKVAEEEQELVEDSYEGYDIYGMWQNEKEVLFSFLDESNILIGNPDQVRFVIDVVRKKKENVFKNEALANLVSKANRDAMFWGAIVFKAGTLDQMTSENPMFQDLKELQSASLAIDYKNQNLTAEIKLMGGDEAKNKQIAEFLTGIKAFGAMMSAEKPEIGELLNKIEITSGPEHVQIYASIPEELLNQLSSELKPKEEREEIK